MLGGPRLLGLSELGSRQLQKQAIVIFACVLQDCKSWKVAFSHFFFYIFLFFFFFFINFLRLCTSWNAPSASCWCRVRTVRLIQWAQAIWVCGNVQFSGPALSRTQTKINTASTKKRHPGHQSTPLDGGRGWWPETFQLEVQSFNIL